MYEIVKGMKISHYDAKGLLSRPIRIYVSFA